MDAILLAGGYGTRLRPLTYTRPKPLLPVAGRPMLEWVLDRLPPEVHRVVVAVNWRAQALGTYFQQRATRAAGDRREFIVVKEDEPLGTGGAVKNCERHLTGDRFFVLNADIVSAIDMGAMVAAHKLHGGVGTISLKEVEPAEVVHYGVIKPAGPAHAGGAIPIADFVEKPKDPEQAPSRLINAGAYLLNRSVLDLLPEGRMVSMEKEVFPHLIPQGFYGLPLHGHWIDVGDPQRLRQASRTLDPGFRFGPGTRLADGARFEDSLAGRDCHVGVGASLERCILGDGVTVRDGVRLTDCVVGDNEAVGHDAKDARIWTKPVPPGYPQKQVGNALA
ncbi:MAG TPA: NDP-sugar synthase [Candidatus Thermoplasmatota archaeon]|nr:NDP-sugar synthase [Candidatus Thermoplasmatota archaeon]